VFLYCCLTQYGFYLANTRKHASLADTIHPGASYHPILSSSYRPSRIESQIWASEPWFPGARVGFLAMAHILVGATHSPTPLGGHGMPPQPNGPFIGGEEALRGC
jgi:hypothetical protein